MIEVRGYIDDLLANKDQKDAIRNIEDQDEFLMSMIDSPIIYKGKAIGVINDIDLDENTWCGIIWGDMVIDIDPCRGHISSFQLIK